MLGYGPQWGANEMSSELSKDQISILCNIGDKARPLLDLQDVRGSDLEILFRQGYVEATKDRCVSSYRLTVKGNAFLSERGAGLNEA